MYFIFCLSLLSPHPCRVTSIHYYLSGGISPFNEKSDIQFITFFIYLVKLAVTWKVQLSRDDMPFKRDKHPHLPNYASYLMSFHGLWDSGNARQKIMRYKFRRQFAKQFGEIKILIILTTSFPKIVHSCKFMTLCKLFCEFSWLKRFKRNQFNHILQILHSK